MGTVRPVGGPPDTAEGFPHNVRKEKNYVEVSSYVLRYPGGREASRIFFARPLDNRRRGCYIGRVSTFLNLTPMTKAYRVSRHQLRFGSEPTKEVYGIAPVNYGTLTTEDAAAAISEGSTVTTGDVKAVLDRYAQYVKENLKKGYDVELLGFGTLTVRFMIAHSVDDPKMANAKLVSSLLPAFRPSYTMHNGTRIYSLLPDKVTLVKYGDNNSGESTSSDPSEGDNGSDENEGPDII